jgi:hypothetical protein
MPKWRPFSWVILVINILFLIWVIAGISSAGGTAEDCGTLSTQDCEAAEAIGTSIGVGIIIALWAFVDVILGVLWLVTKPKRRPCPVCGTEVKHGVTVCPKCGHDFRTAAQGTVPPPPPPGTTSSAS